MILFDGLVFVGSVKAAGAGESHGAPADAPVLPPARTGGKATPPPCTTCRAKLDTKDQGDRGCLCRTGGHREERVTDVYAN
jgi:hypothetical protein